MSNELIHTLQQQCLETCLNLPSYDYKVERVYQETVKLFASEEIRKRLQEKRGKAL